MSARPAASAGTVDPAGRPSADRSARLAASDGTAPLVLRETVSVTAPENPRSRNSAACLHGQPADAHCRKMAAVLHLHFDAAHGPKTAAVLLHGKSGKPGKRAANRSRLHRSCCVQPAHSHFYSHCCFYCSCRSVGPESYPEIFRIRRLHGFLSPQVFSAYDTSGFSGNFLCSKKTPFMYKWLAYMVFRPFIHGP